MAVQLPDGIIPTLLHSSLYWRRLETCKLHFPDSLACWPLVAFCQWERMTGDCKVEEREKLFFSRFWWYLWHSRWPSVFPAAVVMDNCWWLPATEGYSESSRSDIRGSYRLQWPLVFSGVTRIPKASAVFERFHWLMCPSALVTPPLPFCSSSPSNGSSSLWGSFLQLLLSGFLHLSLCSLCLANNFVNHFLY